MANICDYEGHVKCPRPFTESEIDELEKIVHEEMEYDGESYIEVDAYDKTFVKLFGCFRWSGISHHNGMWIKTLSNFMAKTNAECEIWTNECGNEFTEYIDLTPVLDGREATIDCYDYSEFPLGEIVDGEVEYDPEELKGTILEGYSLDQLKELYDATNGDVYYYPISSAWEPDEDKIYRPPFSVNRTVGGAM